MLATILNIAVLLALPVVILIACCQRPDPNHEFIIDLLEENLTDHRGGLKHVD